jgi:hypothetical protein
MGYSKGAFSTKLTVGVFMSSAPVLQTATEEVDDLSREQWWALFDELRLSQQKAYAEVGGAVAFLRRERDADAPSV